MLGDPRHAPRRALPCLRLLRTVRACVGRPARQSERGALHTAHARHAHDMHTTVSGPSTTHVHVTCACTCYHPPSRYPPATLPPPVAGCCRLHSRAMRTSYNPVRPGARRARPHDGAQVGVAGRSAGRLRSGARVGGARAGCNPATALQPPCSPATRRSKAAASFGSASSCGPNQAV